MTDVKNVFISHVHEDDELLPKLRDLVSRAGMDVRDGSITSEKPNDAKSEAYIKQQILRPRIRWAGALVVLITNDTADSSWVNWEIEEAVSQGKPVVGVFAQGATDADVPEALDRCGDAAIVGWQGDRVVAAIRGELNDWDDPATGQPRSPEWVVRRHSC